MLERIKQRLTECAWIHEEYGLNPERILIFDASNGRVDGLCCLLFTTDGDTPSVIGKGAMTETGRAVMRTEYHNLKELDQRGMNADWPATPRPLDLWESDGQLIAFQSALPGALLKNIPGRTLFSPEELPKTLNHLMRWWTKLHETCGTQPVAMDDAHYAREVAAPVRAYLRRYFADDAEADFLRRRFLDTNAFDGMTLPFMARHGDFAAANMTLMPEGLGVFDWEFPLSGKPPLFDVFFFFASLRYPFQGRRGETGHFESFKTIFWDTHYLNRALRETIATFCERYGIPAEAVADLFILSLVLTANMKYVSLIQSTGVTETPGEQQPAPREKDARWTRLGYPDKDVPFACLEAGRFENLRHTARVGPPQLI